MNGNDVEDKFESKTTIFEGMSFGLLFSLFLSKVGCWLLVLLINNDKQHLDSQR